MATGSVSPKAGKILDLPGKSVTIGTATADNGSASITFTAGSETVGGPTIQYQAISSPGSFTGTASTSPVTVTGLTNGTSYTFQVAAKNPTGIGTYSSSSNSVIPLEPGSFEFIQGYTLTGNTSYVDFSSIPSTYKHLQIRCFTRTTWGTAFVYSLNSDTGANYTRHEIYSANSSGGVSLGAGANTAATGEANNNVIAYCAFDNMNSSIYSTAVIDILDYTNTNKFTTLRSLSGYDQNGGEGYIVGISAAWKNTAAVTTIRLRPQGGYNFKTDSHFALYGVKA